MDVHIRLTRRGDLSVQIYRQLLDAVLDGRLRSGERLPPTRELAHRLAVSRNTVGVAYERLVAEGVLVGRVGAGSFVSAEPLHRAQTRRAPAGAVHPRDVWRAIPAPSLVAPSIAPYDFSVGTPDPRCSPSRHGVASSQPRCAHRPRATRPTATTRAGPSTFVRRSHGTSACHEPFEPMPTM